MGKRKRTKCTINKPLPFVENRLYVSRIIRFGYGHILMSSFLMFSAVNSMFFCCFFLRKKPIYRVFSTKYNFVITNLISSFINFIKLIYYCRKGISVLLKSSFIVFRLNLQVVGAKKTVGWKIHRP